MLLGEHLGDPRGRESLHCGGRRQALLACLRFWLAPWVKPHPLPCQSRSEHLITHLSTSIESAAAIPIRSRTEAQYRHTFRSPLTRSSAKLGYETTAL